MGGSIVFETERLVVRRWIDSDQPLVLELYGQPEPEIKYAFQPSVWG